MLELKNVLIECLIAVITVTVPIVTKFLIAFLRSKSTAVKETAATENERRILEQIDQAVEDSVDYVSQTVVDTLKSTNQFDKDAQRQAFQTALVTTLNGVSEEARKFLYGTYNDVTGFLTTKIEAAVRRNKLF